MKKGVVVYKSKYGSSKRYAEKIAEKCCFDCRNLKEIKVSDLKDYDIIVFCGGVYASGISYRKFLNKNYNKIKDKEIILFFNGASPFDEPMLKQIIKNNFRSELTTRPIYYGRGMWNLDKMSKIDKALCKLLIKMVSKKESKDLQPWEQALMEANSKNCDWTDEKFIEPLIDYVLKTNK